MAILIKNILLLAFLVGLGFAEEKLNGKATIAVEYYYTANNDQDGDFIVSQLLPELQTSDLSVLTFAYGGVQVLNIPDSQNENKYYCTGPNSLCETNLIHRCIQRNYATIQLDFLACFFQNELFPVDLIGANQQCITKLSGAAAWNAILSCSKDAQTMDEYGRTYFAIEALKPSVEQTPYLLLNDKHSPLAPIDLKKALCRTEATDIWQCESVDRFKEPIVEIFYTPYEDDSRVFFRDQLTLVQAQNVFDTTERVDLLPNPNGVIGYSTQAHWCLFQSFSGIHQVEIVQCTFSKIGASSEERIKQCVSDSEFQAISNCVADFQDYMQQVQMSQERLNLLISQSQQQSVEILVRDKPNVKARNGLLQELCSNYFKVDDETLGCKVNRPQVQIFYETQSTTVQPKFAEMINFAQYAPFDTIANFEFIPYGNTKYENGSYICPQSEDQCHANWAHACIFNARFSTIEQQFQFIEFFLCATQTVEGLNPINQAEGCVNQVYDDGPNFWVNTVHLCMNLNDELKDQLRTKTEAIGLTQIPEIAVNGEKNTTQMGNTMLLNLCRSIQPIKPKVCAKIDTDSSQTLQVQVYLSADSSSAAFVRQQIKPLLANPRDASLRLRDVIEWKFVPWGTSQYNETTGIVTCANGEEECLANRILTCAGRQRQNGKLGAREDALRVVSFVVCFFDSTNWQTDALNASSTCIDTLSPLDSYAELWQCALQDIKLPFWLEMKNITENNYPAIANFPSVSINQAQPSIVPTLTLANSLCRIYKASPLPLECRTGGGGGGGGAHQNHISIFVVLWMGVCTLYMLF